MFLQKCIQGNQGGIDHCLNLKPWAESGDSFELNLY